MDRPDNLLWNLLFYFALSAAVVACFLVLNRKEFFPEQYATHHAGVQLHQESGGKLSPENHPEKETEKELPDEGHRASENEVSEKEGQTAHTSSKAEGHLPAQTQLAHAEKEAPSAGEAQYILVVGAFVSEARANALKEKLIFNYPETKIASIIQNDKSLFRVEAARSRVRNEIVELQKGLINNGYSDCWFYKK